MLNRASILIPHDTNSICAEHTANVEWAAARWRVSLPEVEVIVGGVGRANRSANRNALARAASGDMLLWFDGDAVVADPRAVLDYVCEALQAGNPLVRLGGGVRWLGRPTTRKLLAEPPPTGPMPEDTWPPHVRIAPSPAQGGTRTSRHGGLMYATTRRNWERIQWDERFVDWGREDTAWTYAIERLIGRGHWAPQFAWHLWHPRTRAHKWRSSSAQANHERWLQYQGASTEELQALVAGANRSERNLWY